MSLRCAQVFFRHGARTPLKHIPNVDEVIYDKDFLLRPVQHTEVPIAVCDLDGGPAPPRSLDKYYKKTQFLGGCAAGRLTALGKDQAYLLGQQLKERYLNQYKLINTTFQKNEIGLRSTNVDRCIESLQCVLAGIYGVLHFSEDDPVVIPVSPFAQEILFPNLHHCRTLNSLEKKIYCNEDRIPGLSAIREKISNIIGYDGRLDMMTWRDHIYAREVHGLKIPDFMLELRSEIETAAVESIFAYHCGFPEDRTLVLQLGAGPVLYKIQENFDKAAKNDIQEKLHLFSCHDSSLVPLLTALGVFDNKWPAYTASIMFELLEDDKGQHWVQVLYCGKEMVLNGQSQSIIPLESFRDIIKPYAVSPTQYEMNCGNAKLAKDHAAVWDIHLKTAEDDIEKPRSM